MDLEGLAADGRAAGRAPVRGGLADPDDEADSGDDDGAAGGLSPRARLAASRELGKAMRFVRALKASYVALAIVVGLFFLLMLAASGLGPWTLACGAIAVLSLVGARRIERHPLRWSLILATAATLLAAARLVVMLEAPTTSGLPIGLGIVVLAYWTVVGLARKIETTVRRHPDLWLARRMRGETIEDERGAVSTKHRDRANAERRARRRRRLAIAVVGVAVVVGVTFAFARILRPDESSSGAELPAPATPATAAFAHFRDAWNANRLAEVRGDFLPESRVKFAKGLDRIIERRAWKPLPALGIPQTTDEGRYASAVFPLPNGQGDLYTSWAWDDATRSWGINALRPPKD